MLALALWVLGFANELPAPAPPAFGDHAWQPVKVVDGGMSGRG